MQYRTHVRFWQGGNSPAPEEVPSIVQLELTDRAAAVIRRKGGTAVVDLLEPFG